MDPKPTSYVTKNALNQPVSIVTTNVLIVLIALPIVSTVPETEFPPQNVPAQKEPMTPVLKFAHIAILNAQPVKKMPKTVLLVPKEELTHLLVNVHTDLMTMVRPVNHVTSIVLHVPLNTLVSIVLETESMPQFVTVQLTHTIMVPQLVQLVKTNVTLVSTCQITVLLVLKVESTHQSVMSQNQLPNPLKSKMSQSDLPNQLIVTADVKLVKDQELTVSLVTPTELTPLLVDVLLVIMKILTVLVKIVHTLVLPVLHLLIVTFVKIQLTEFQPNVNVLMDTLMPVFQTVMSVPSNV